MRREAWLTELVEEGRITWLQKAIVSQALHRHVKQRRPRPLTGPEFSSKNALHNFLMKIAPPLPHLIPYFQELGIVDGDSLYAAARLENRDVCLKQCSTHQVMTELETRLVGEAMAELLRHSHHFLPLRKV